MSRAKKGGTGGGRALDDLMMAYADLNAPTKNQGRRASEYFHSTCANLLTFLFVGYQFMTYF